MPCQVGMALTCKGIFVSFYGITLYLVWGKNGLLLLIVYHCHLFEKTRFLEDLFRQTKGLRPFQRSGEVFLDS